MKLREFTKNERKRATQTFASVHRTIAQQLADLKERPLWWPGLPKSKQHILKKYVLSQFMGLYEC